MSTAMLGIALDVIMGAIGLASGDPERLQRGYDHLRQVVKVEFIRLEQGYIGWKEWNESKHSSMQARGTFADEEMACLARTHGEERLEIKRVLFQIGRRVSFNIHNS